MLFLIEMIKKYKCIAVPMQNFQISRTFYQLALKPLVAKWNYGFDLEISTDGQPTIYGVAL